MSEADKQKIQELHAELDEVLEYCYSPIYKLLITLIFFVVSIIVVLAIGDFWAIVIFLIVFFPDLLGMKKKNNAPTQKELVRAALSIMSQCVNIVKYPGSDIMSQTSRQILNYEYFHNNLKLYKEFIKLFPHKKSLKLWDLARVTPCKLD